MYDIKIQKEVGEKLGEKSAEKQKKKKKMKYKLFTLEEQQNMFEKEQNPEELNKIMGAISNKHDVLADDNEETNNVQLEKEIY